MAVHAEALAGGAEPGEQNDGKRIEQQQPVATYGGLYTRHSPLGDRLGSLPQAPLSLSSDNFQSEVLMG